MNDEIESPGEFDKAFHARILCEAELKKAVEAVEVAFRSGDEEQIQKAIERRDHMIEQVERWSNEEARAYARRSRGGRRAAANARIGLGVFLILLTKVAVTVWYIAGIVGFYRIFNARLIPLLIGLIPGSAVFLTWVNREPGEPWRWVWLLSLLGISLVLWFGETLSGIKVRRD